MDGLSFYQISGLFGYFLIMIIAILIGTFVSNKKISWVIFAVGAILTLISLIGKQRSLSALGLSGAMTLYWIVYVILLIGGAALVGLVRRNK